MLPLYQFVPSLHKTFVRKFLALPTGIASGFTILPCRTASSWRPPQVWQLAAITAAITAAPNSNYRSTTVLPPTFLRPVVGGGTEEGRRMNAGRTEEPRREEEIRWVRMPESLELPRGLACLRVRSHPSNNSARGSTTGISQRAPGLHQPKIRINRLTT